MRFSPNFCCGSQILLFHMCFGIRILSPFHLATQIIYIQNLNCSKMQKTHVQTRFLNCPPADHPAFKLPVHVAHVGVGHMPGGVILLPPKPVEVATVLNMQTRQHMVLK